MPFWILWLFYYSYHHIYAGCQQSSKHATEKGLMNQERFYQSGFPLFFLYVEAGTVNISHFKAAKVMNIVITTYETMYFTARQREEVPHHQDPAIINMNRQLPLGFNKHMQTSLNFVQQPFNKTDSDLLHVWEWKLWFFSSKKAKGQCHSRIKHR